MSETTNYTRNESALHSLEILKRSVLDVLYHVHCAEARTFRKRLLQPGEIRQRLGLPRPLTITGTTNALIHGVLQYLHDDKLVKYDIDHGWEITEKGIKEVQQLEELQ